MVPGRPSGLRLRQAFEEGSRQAGPNDSRLQRQQLVNVFVLVDVRLEPQKIDLEFIEWLGMSSIPFAIVFTKGDKLTPNKARQAVEDYKKKLLETWEELPPIFLTSAEKKEGRNEVLDYIEQINEELKA